MEVLDILSRAESPEHPHLRCSAPETWSLPSTAGTSCTQPLLLFCRPGSKVGGPKRAVQTISRSKAQLANVLAVLEKGRLKDQDKAAKA